MQKIQNWWPNNPAIYDIEKSWHENLVNGPFFKGEIPARKVENRSEWQDFLGFKIASPLGVPAGPLLNSNWIGLAADLGFDVLTYKTIRTHAHPSHAAPNVVPVNTEGSLIPGNLPDHLNALSSPPSRINEIGITNSFGNPSQSPEYLQEDIARAKGMLNPGQVMIVSVFGTDHDGIEMGDDFAQCAAFAKEAGAEIIEANYSCPNVSSDQGSLYANSDAVFDFSTRIIKAIGDTPLIIKMGIFDHPENLKATLVAAARAGVRGVCGINTISMKVYNEKEEAALGNDRLTCGICGNPIREAALSFIRQAREIIDREKLELTLIGTGGVTLPEHFNQFLDAGAEVTMTATGMMWDPLLAMRYHNTLKHAGV